MLKILTIIALALFPVISFAISTADLLLTETAETVTPSFDTVWLPHEAIQQSIKAAAERPQKIFFIIFLPSL